MSSEIRVRIEGPAKTVKLALEPGVYTIGSDPECVIRLPHPLIEARHAILNLRGIPYNVEDLESMHGTYIDGSRVHGHMEFSETQRLAIGPFTLIFGAGDSRDAASSTGEKSLDSTPPSDSSGSRPHPESPALRHSSSSPPTSAARLDEQRLLDRKRAIKQQIHRELVERLDLKRLAATEVNKNDLRERAQSTVQAIVRETSDRLPRDIPPDLLVKEICDEALGLGPLEDLLADPDITEIMVNGPANIYVEKSGRLVRTDKGFMDADSVMAVMERIVSPLGRRIDESQPYVDARLPDGSRVNAIIPPLSLSGPCLTIRKFSAVPLTDADLIHFGTMPQWIAAFLKICVLSRKNIIVSGGTGCGKTTLLNVLSAYLPSSDRIVTIEDAAELRLGQEHVVRLESRPPNIEGKGAVSIRDLVRNALRMRPDRIVVGECRGGEALDMLQAMNTGHDGSLTTVHANSPRDVISRLETMVLMSGMDLPLRAIREQVAAAIDVIVHESRLADGSRKIVRVSEIVGLEGDQITMQDIFEFEQTGVNEQGLVEGVFRPTGSVPTFIDEISARGLQIDRTIFDPQSRREDD